MATHDYKCTECNFTAEYMRSVSLPKELNPPDICPECGKGMMEKQYSVNSVTFEVIHGTPIFYGKKNWKRNPEHAADVLMNNKTPY